MENLIVEKFMENFASNMAVVVSLASLISTTVITVGTALLNSHNARKLKMMELTYAQKLESYSNYLKVTAEIQDILDQAQLTALENASNRVILFASHKTRALLLAHKKEVQKTLLAKFASPNDVNSYAERASEIGQKLTLSMRRDLDKS